MNNDQPEYGISFPLSQESQRQLISNQLTSIPSIAPTERFSSTFDRGRDLEHRLQSSSLQGTAAPSQSTPGNSEQIYPDHQSNSTIPSTTENTSIYDNNIERGKRLQRSVPRSYLEKSNEKNKATRSNKPSSSDEAVLPRIGEDVPVQHQSRGQSRNNRGGEIDSGTKAAEIDITRSPTIASELFLPRCSIENINDIDNENGDRGYESGHSNSNRNRAPLTFSPEPKTNGGLRPNYQSYGRFEQDQRTTGLADFDSIARGEGHNSSSQSLLKQLPNSSAPSNPRGIQLADLPANISSSDGNFNNPQLASSSDAPLAEESRPRQEQVPTDPNVPPDGDRVILDTYLIPTITFIINLHNPDPAQIRSLMLEIAEPDIRKALPCVKRQFFSSAKSLAAAYLLNPCESVLVRILLLPKVGLSHRLGHRSANKALQLMRALSDLAVDQISIHYTSNSPLPLSPTEKAMKLINKGCVSKAFRTLSSSSPPPIVTDTVIAELQELQAAPDTPRRVPLTRTGQPPLALDYEDIATGVYSLNSASSAGLSGWNAILLRFVLKDHNFSKFLLHITNNQLAGQVPTNCSQYLLSSIAFPLFKSCGIKFRCIAVMEIFYRLASKIAVSKGRLENDLLPNQFGVNSPYGVDPAFHMIENHLQDPSNAVVSIDVKGAFDNISRNEISDALFEIRSPLYRFFQWAYGSPSPLYLRYQLGHVVTMK